MSFPSDRRAMSPSLCAAVAVLCVSIVSLGECYEPTMTPATPCAVYKNCDTCVPHARCLWCFSTNNCTEYPVRWLLPPASLCPLADARWGMCWLNFEALIITMAVIGGIILIGIMVFCCWCCRCCCCKKRGPRPDRDEELLARRLEENKQRAEERKVNKNARHDEIRKKYGLLSDSDHPYSKFENE
ncbi:pituitary tumor-transforming gene 1 protein-interacting protein isoform X2 [Limanda limanda]|uniref:pituitary tumor-transforming gene 1 protein-interacting protein isoform X2 n=1 Tax=Limanda limanda TaxID=27771 RepID=UPI0029C70580|nr:pituitary tumor-transforming gene 1 protein-interacting protein isoform X2 [Limanda limanda]